MNLNDLIVGHYEGSLSAAEQAELQGLLSSSPDARHLFEQHGLIEGSMRNEAAAIAPSHELRERTLAAAIAFAPQAIGGGALGWLSGKVAAAISAFVVGGVAIGIAVTNDDHSSTVNPPVQTPAVTAPANTELATPQPAGSTVEAAEQTRDEVEVRRSDNEVDVPSAVGEKDIRHSAPVSNRPEPSTPEVEPTGEGGDPQMSFPAEEPTEMTPKDSLRLKHPNGSANQ